MLPGLQAGSPGFGRAGWMRVSTPGHSKSRCVLDSSGTAVSLPAPAVAQSPRAGPRPGPGLPRRSRLLALTRLAQSGYDRSGLSDAASAASHQNDHRRRLPDRPDQLRAAGAASGRNRVPGMRFAPVLKDACAYSHPGSRANPLIHPERRSDHDAGPGAGGAAGDCGADVTRRGRGKAWPGAGPRHRVRPLSPDRQRNHTTTAYLPASPTPGNASGEWQRRDDAVTSLRSARLAGDRHAAGDPRARPRSTSSVSLVSPVSSVAASTSMIVFAGR